MYINIQQIGDMNFDFIGDQAQGFKINKFFQTNLFRIILKEFKLLGFQDHHKLT